jgi:hypothetical protein
MKKWENLLCFHMLVILVGWLKNLQKRVLEGVFLVRSLAGRATNG